jgi:Phage integrase family
LFPASFRLVLKKPPARRAAQSISIRDPAVRAVHDTPNPANCSRLPGDGRHSQPLHPHLFRHQMLTYLTSKGLTDAQIQLISGYESKKSLEIYQHLSLESVDKAYQDAVQSVGI